MLVALLQLRSPVTYSLIGGGGGGGSGQALADPASWLEAVRATLQGLKALHLPPHRVSCDVFRCSKD